MSAARKFKTGAMSWAAASGTPPALRQRPKRPWQGWPPHLVVTPVTDRGAASRSARASRAANRRKPRTRFVLYRR
jgi:hypothetical protein